MTTHHFPVNSLFSVKEKNTPGWCWRTLPKKIVVPMHVFKKINGTASISNGGSMEDYWFGHWIQHGSGIKWMWSSLMYVSSRPEKRSILVKNFSWIIIDPCIVVNDSKIVIFLHIFKMHMRCMDHGNVFHTGKSCCSCHDFHVCLDCYDKHQI